MSSTTASTSSETTGLGGGVSRDSSVSSQLQRLCAVPGSEPNRVNDLLLVRPDTEEQSCSWAEGRSGNNRHVVFFHGDIQVRRKTLFFLLSNPNITCQTIQHK